MGIFRQYMGLRKENYILIFGRMVTNFGSMVFPILTLLMTQRMGYSASLTAAILTISGLIMVPSGMLGGKLADHMNKKWLIVALDLFSIVLYCTSAFIPLTDRTILMLVSASIFQNMEHPAYSALLADITRTEDRDRAFSLMYLACNLGLVASPTLAGILYENHLWLCFLLSGLSIACSTVMITFWLKDITPVHEDSVVSSYQTERSGVTLLQILKENPLICLYVTIFGMYAACYQGYFYMLPLDLGQIHGDKGALIYGSITSICCLVVVIFTPIFTNLFQKNSQPVKVTIGLIEQLLGYGMFLAALSFLPSAARLIGYYLAMTVFTFGEIMETLAQGPYLSARIPSTHRGRINGFSSVIQNLLQSGMLMSIGLLYDHAGRGASWMVIIALLAAAILLSILQISLDRKSYPALYER